jgi:cellobiose-specific phosphotransferase system component IIB
MAREFHLGHFLKQYHFEKAVLLLKEQLKQTSPLYNNLDFSLYRQSEIDTIVVSEFYNDYIKRDSLYYFENKFYSKKYYGVQRAYKTREFHYLSLSSLIAYYALGMYVRELLDKKIGLVTEIYKSKNIDVFYGGKLNFENPITSKIFYYEDYKEFIGLKESLTKPVDGKVKYAISLDIKSFFYTIDHKILFDLIDSNCTPTLKQSLNFNELTKESIVTLLRFFQHNNLGLPVSNQNIISSFLSSIYFSRFDQYVADKYLHDSNFSYIRYVDDFYLIFEEDGSTSLEDIRQKIYDIENDFSEYLINKLNLSVSSSKCDRFCISDEESQLEFLNASSLDSPFDLEFDLEDLYKDSILSIEIQDKKIPEIFDECISIIQKLKNQSTELPQLSIDTKESAYLNYILILKACLAYSKSEEAIRKIEESKIFENIQALDFILIKPKVFFHLMTLTETSRNSLFQFIKSNLETNRSITQKLTILDKFFHQITFLISDTKNETKANLQAEFIDYKNEILPILKIIKEKDIYDLEYLNLIINSLDSNHSLSTFNPVYNPSFLNLNDSIPLTQQIKLRKLNELLLNYNVCFNHLLNEFQSLFERAYFAGDSKTALAITRKMAEENYSIDEIQLISNFFERRNQNSISHTNENDIGVWGVNLTEYTEYKKSVLPILTKLNVSLN